MRIIRFLLNPVPALAIVSGLILLISCQTAKTPIVIVDPKPQKDMLITNKTSDEVVEQAVQLVNKCLLNEKFLSNLNNYDYTFNPIGDVESVFREADKSASVYFYTSWNPWTSAIAYREGSKINLNTRKHKNRTLLMVFKTVIHEYSHVLGFSHPFKYSKERDESVPYLIETIAEKHCILDSELSL